MSISETEKILDTCVKRGFHMVALQPWSEVPVSRTWRTDAGLTHAEALAHVAEGGNLAVHCAKSNIAVVVAPTPAAIAAMHSQGHAPMTVTPHGAAHYYFKVPPQLKEIPPQHSVVFGNLSEVQVLSGDRLVVIPPSRVLICP